MRVGILTFHSQLNYGGVLQCWALLRVLKNLGHDVVVIDRWLTANNGLLEGPFVQSGIFRWGKILLKSLIGCGDLERAIRYWRTRKFVRSLDLTPYHFHDWKDAPKELNVDCLVVGSDQVWHSGGGGFPDPEPYLLEGAPHIRAIAYAASFGMKELPNRHDYSSGFRRFSAISVREFEGVKLVASKGVTATHVADPTLLLNLTSWREFGKWPKIRRRLVCYFLSQNIEKAFDLLVPWAIQNDCTVEILCDNAQKAAITSLRALLLRAHQIVKHMSVLSRVRVCSCCGPREFVRAFAQAEMCITDSFHAVMFSSIYKCNVRFLKPADESRKGMFARIEEFATHYISGDVFVGNVKMALCSFLTGDQVSFKFDQIEQFRRKSIEWLVKALQGAVNS